MPQEYLILYELRLTIFHQSVRTYAKFLPQRMGGQIDQPKYVHSFTIINLHQPGQDHLTEYYAAATVIPDGHLGLRHRLVVLPHPIILLPSASKPASSAFTGGGLTSASSSSTVSAGFFLGFLPLVRRRLVKLDSQDPPVV